MKIKIPVFLFIAFIFQVITGFISPSTAAEFKDGILAYRMGDYPAALEVLRPLADRGDPESQNLLGWIYISENNKSQTRDVQKSVKWFQKAAEQGHSKAQFNLGRIFMHGRIVQRDYSQAAYWFLKAAEKGSQGAQFYLARFYDVGIGVPKDEDKAANLWKNLAEHGWAVAQYETGKNYRKGRGVPKDLVSAYMWADLAARSDRNRPANDLLQLVSRHMSAEQIGQADRMAREWSPKVVNAKSRNMDVQYQFSDSSGKDSSDIRITLPF